MEAWLLKVVGTMNGFLSDYLLLVLLLGIGIWYTVKTKFVQVRCFGQGAKNVFKNVSLKGKKEKSGMSSFQAFATAVAGQVGTGNIIGASGAILLGGPGAIFWVWIIAFLGMATIYAEAVLAQKTRVVDENGNVSGGPVHYIKKAFPNKFGKSLAGFFAVATVLALGFIGAMVQSNSIGEAIHNATDGFAPTWVVGLGLVVLCGFIFIGSVFVALCLTFFAFSTIISWNLFDKINFEYLFGKKGLVLYSILSLAFILLGSIFKNDLVWELTDFFNYLMVLPNVIALFALTKLATFELKENGPKPGKSLYKEDKRLED